MVVKQKKRVPTIANTYSISKNVHTDIKDMLVEAGAQDIHEQYSPHTKQLEALSFNLPIGGGSLKMYKVPIDVEAVKEALKKQATTPLQRDRAVDQAYQTAWAIVRDWLRINLTMIRVGNLQARQLFLPFQLTPSGATVFEVIEENDMELPRLPTPDTTIFLE